MGSGMGTLLEGLWLYTLNREFDHEHDGKWELAWLPDHEYNDFALLTQDNEWERSSRRGELLRIEAKSMVLGADESKAHFDEIERKIGEHDQILVLVWSWEQVGTRIQPAVFDYFLGSAAALAALRDALHITRGGTFIDRKGCPDGCAPADCTHHGEPLNADGKRERAQGPESCRVSQRVSYAANFGGMVRMLKTNSNDARKQLRRCCMEHPVAREYVAFIWRLFPDEELNHFSISEWRRFAEANGLPTDGVSKADLVSHIRASVDGYRDALLDMFCDAGDLDANGDETRLSE